MKLEGKKVSVYFDDGSRVTRKDGVLSSEDDYSITLDDKEVISRNRIIRMVVG